MSEQGKKIKLLKDLPGADKGSVHEINSGLFGEELYIIINVENWPSLYRLKKELKIGEPNAFAEYVKDDPEEGEAIYYIGSVNCVLEVTEVPSYAKTGLAPLVIEQGNWSRSKEVMESELKKLLDGLEEKRRRGDE